MFYQDRMCGLNEAGAFHPQRRTEWWSAAACMGLRFDEVGWEQLLIGCFVSDSYVI